MQSGPVFASVSKTGVDMKVNAHRVSIKLKVCNYAQLSKLHQVRIRGY
jgi:hypothetical protein